MSTDPDLVPASGSYPDADVLIVGGGTSGLMLAASLAQSGLQAIVLEQQAADVLANPQPDGREIALSHPSVDTLRRIGIWDRLAAHEVGLLRQARVHNGPVGERRAMVLHAGGTGIDHLGWIVPNQALRRTAHEVAASTPGVRLVTGAQVQRVSVADSHAELEFVLRGADDAPVQRLRAPLLVAADSRFSSARRQLGIGTSMSDLGRTMILCRLHHERPHDEVAHECFGYDRTMAILPLPNDPDGDAPMCSAVVTVPAGQVDELLSLPPEDYAARVARQFQHRLGAMRMVGECYSYPLVTVYAHRFAGHRCALVGDAAVGMHPVTAHGFNLGVAAVARLAQALNAARRRGADLGAIETLRSFSRTHHRQAWPLYQGTNFVAGLYADSRALPRMLRQAVMAGSSRLPPLQALIVSQLTGRRPAWPKAQTQGH